MQSQNGVMVGRCRRYWVGVVGAKTKEGIDNSLSDPVTNYKPEVAFPC